MNAPAVGSTTWVFPGGFIPAGSTGPEPARTSREELCVLNAGDDDAEIEITVFHERQDPVGPYPLVVAARRMRNVRINDLIDPQAVPLGVPFAAVVRSNVPIVAQLNRTDTSDGGLSITVASGVALE